MFTYAVSYSMNDQWRSIINMLYTILYKCACVVWGHWLKLRKRHAESFSFWKARVHQYIDRQCEISFQLETLAESYLFNFTALSLKPCACFNTPWTGPVCWKTFVLLWALEKCFSCLHLIQMELYLIYSSAISCLMACFL